MKHFEIFMSSPRQGLSRAETTIVLAGLIGGLLLGIAWMRPAVSHSDARDELRDSAHGPTRLSPQSTGDREVDALKRRIATLERQAIERRLAVPEDDLDEPADPGADDDAGQEKGISAAAASGSRNTRNRRNAVAGESAPSASPGQATLAYWNALNDIIAREAAMRLSPENLTAVNAGGFVAARIEAGQFASKAIRDLDTSGIDPDAAALGRELIAWYQEEASLNERAQSLFGSSDIAARKGAAGTAWRSGEERHRRQCDEINRRAADLRSRLSRTYRLDFPKLN